MKNDDDFHVAAAKVRLTHINQVNISAWWERERFIKSIARLYYSGTGPRGIQSVPIKIHFQSYVVIAVTAFVVVTMTFSIN